MPKQNGDWTDRNWKFTMRNITSYCITPPPPPASKSPQPSPSSSMAHVRRCGRRLQDSHHPGVWSPSCQSHLVVFDILLGGGTRCSVGCLKIIIITFRPWYQHFAVWIFTASVFAAVVHQLLGTKTILPSQQVARRLGTAPKRPIEGVN